MAKLPLACPIFGHADRVHREVYSFYEKCRRCDRIKHVPDYEITQFEIKAWQILMHRTGRSLADLQNDQVARNEVWDLVNEQRSRLLEYEKVSTLRDCRDLA